MNICDWTDRWAEVTPGKVALLFEEHSWTYAEFARAVREYAAVLRCSYGVREGDRVAYLGLNSPEFLFLMFACARIGAIIVPLNWRLVKTELESLVRHADPSLLIADRDMQSGWFGTDDFRSCTLVSMEADRHEGWEHFPTGRSEQGGLEMATAGDDNPLLLVYTSGTTGEPKGALLSQRAILANAENSKAMHQLNEEDVSLVSLPFFHVGGLNILTTPTLYVGGTVSLHRTFDPEQLLQAMTDEHPTRVPIVSAQMPPILSQPAWRSAEFPGLISVTTGASPVSPSVYSSWREKGVAVLQVYGATETCPIAICTRIDEPIPDIRTAGRAAVGCEVKIVNDSGGEMPLGQAGEILIHGANLMTGYWQDPAATRKAIRDGWYASGDIGYCDKDGFYYVTDRKSDVIISGGENIYPAEIESVLLKQEGIAEVAVIGKPDDRWGEVPVAVVISKEGRTLAESDILASLEGHLGRYKLPKAIVFIDEFPRNTVGKIQKFALREQLFRK